MKNKLSQAIAAATLVGIAGAANAMHVNDKGLGEILLYPLYTVDNSNDTYVSLTNTTSEFKAVKVRFLEHKNSQEVFDFNLYLSPYDQWSAVVTLGKDKDGNDAPVIKTPDNSCTSGVVPGMDTDGEAFRNTMYGVDGSNDVDQSLLRAGIGHIEIIEMGNLDPNFELIPGTTVRQAIEHDKDGKPGNCSRIDSAFNALNGAWNDERNGNVQNGFKDYADPDKDVRPAPGLYGTASIINVDAGWQSNYDALALANTYEEVEAATRHARPGTVNPSFDQVAEDFVIFDGAQATTYLTTDTNGVSAGINAVSAVLSKSAIMNDYVHGAGLDAQTDMVVTFPTKREYVNVLFDEWVVPPFTKRWNGSTACEKMDLIYWDHEEAEVFPDKDNFSPAQPDNDFRLCYETNLLHVGADSNLFGGDEGHSTLLLKDSHVKGWVRFDFVGKNHLLGAHRNGNTGAVYTPALGDATITDVDAESIYELEGMPVIGFSTIVIKNGELESDVGGLLLSNYASTYMHKSDEPIISKRN